MINKGRYKPLNSPDAPKENPTTTTASNGSFTPQEKIPAVKPKKPVTKVITRKGREQSSLSSDDAECLTVDEDEDFEDEIQRKETVKKKKPERVRKISDSKKDPETGKKKTTTRKANFQKKGSGQTVSLMVGSVATVIGSVVTQDESITSPKDKVGTTTIEGFDDYHESTDVMPNEDNITPTKKMSMAARIGAMVTKNKEKKLVSKESTVNIYKMCPVLEHDQFLSLYCKNRKCRRAICALCLEEEHKGHDVRDLNKSDTDDMESLLSLLDSTDRSFSSLRDRLTNAKQTITQSTKKAVETLEARRDAAMRMFDKLTQEMLDYR